MSDVIVFNCPPNTKAYSANGAYLKTIPYYETKINNWNDFNVILKHVDYEDTQIYPHNFILTSVNDTYILDCKGLFRSKPSPDLSHTNNLGIQLREGSSGEFTYFDKTPVPDNLYTLTIQDTYQSDIYITNTSTNKTVKILNPKIVLKKNTIYKIKIFKFGYAPIIEELYDSPFYRVNLRLVGLSVPRIKTNKITFNITTITFHAQVSLVEFVSELTNYLYTNIKVFDRIPYYFFKDRLYVNSILLRIVCNLDFLDLTHFILVPVGRLEVPSNVKINYDVKITKFESNKRYDVGDLRYYKGIQYKSLVDNNTFDIKTNHWQNI